MKIVIPLITLLLLALIKVVFCTFIPQINVALFPILIISLFKLSTHFRPMFPFFTQRAHRKNKMISLPFTRGVEKKHLPEVGQQHSSFAFLFPFFFFFFFSLSILRKSLLYPRMKLHLGSSISMRHVIPSS